LLLQLPLLIFLLMALDWLPFPPAGLDPVWDALKGTL
jgi:hypothetical protein